ncbi:MAG: hypothetical protein DHS20C02_04070 [Micavibrio sp.]|nr:MAG: hypothetical protein DHS20C02_04070 [Micavibrio sp.]
MSCKKIKFDGANDPDRCKCQGAVMCAYKGMSHEGDKIAFGAAIRVYCFHHPEDTPADASLTVGRWVNEGHFH